jgi:uncharacterized protein YjbI with pentapeptide repeats
MMTAEELLKRYADGERDFSEVDLSKAWLIGVLLEDIVFDKAILKDTRFNRSILTRASFRGADLEGAEFCMSGLEQADFRGANLRNSRIEEAELIRANFEGATGISSFALPAGGYTFKTVLPDGSIDTCSNPEREQAIARGESGFWEST